LEIIAVESIFLYDELAPTYCSNRNKER